MPPETRIENKELEKRITSAADAAELIQDGMTVAVSGFTASGYPKHVPAALAEKAKTEKGFKITLLSGASLGPELDGLLANAKILQRRMPYQTDKQVRDGVNKGEIKYIDMHLSQSARQFRMGGYESIDIAIIEAAKILGDGSIIPTTSVGNSPYFIRAAKKLIVEVNESVPLEIMEMADIFETGDWPNRKEVPIFKPGDRIGTRSIKCDPEKIAAIVITDSLDSTRGFKEPDIISEKISASVLEFLNKECGEGRLGKNLLPIQSGVGSVSNAVLHGLGSSGYDGLTFYTEVIQDAMLDLIKTGKAVCASATAVSPSGEKLKEFYRDIAFYKDKIVLRPQYISNSPEVIGRLGVLAMNTAVEIDIYGNVNSTHIGGTKMINGIGGSGDFARNAAISIFVAPSTRKNGGISSIVPMVSHVDHTEHDVMVVATEYGFADLRCLSPQEKAYKIISNCSHPDYRGRLMEYFDKARSKENQHTPHVFEDAISWFAKL